MKIRFLRGIVGLLFLVMFSFNGLAQTYDQAVDGCEKQQLLWDQIEKSEYTSLPKFTGFEIVPLLNLALPWNAEKAKKYMLVTVTRKDDVFPEGRKKLVHTYGSVAKISFVADENSPFTGLFQGVSCGLARLSLAIKPNVVVLPGAAFKFFVDGEPSRNLQVMNSLTGQMSYNFFAKEFSNVLPDLTSPVVKPLKDLFGTVTRNPTKLSLKPLGDIDQYGVHFAGPEAKYPDKIVFVPDENLVFNVWPHEFRDDLSTIPEGQLLYRVYAEDSSLQRTFLGSIVTTSRFIASKFGDENLFFNHQRIDDD